MGAHSDKHLLYCDWTKRDSLLVSKTEFMEDLRRNFEALATLGIPKNEARMFIPPYEWYNDSIVVWSGQAGLTLFNYTPGTLSHADYTTPKMKNYRSSKAIYRSILEREEKDGLNGFYLLMHIGAGKARRDKFYKRLEELKRRGYGFAGAGLSPGNRAREAELRLDFDYAQPSAPLPSLREQGFFFKIQF